MHKDNRSEDEVYDDGYLRVEYASYYVACGGQPIYNLSRVEMLLFFTMVGNFERPVNHEALWAVAWGKAPLNMHTLRERISKLRLKLIPYGLNIIPMFKVGYRLIRAADEEAQ